VPPSLLIVGAGLAGACAAAWLSDREAVTVLEAEGPACGASGAAAGVVNPLLGPKAHPAWRAEAALDALHATLGRTGSGELFRGGGLLRPARDPRQAEAFGQRAGALPHLAGWLPPEASRERYPEVLAPHGALEVYPGGALDPGALTRRALQASEARVRTGRAVSFGEAGDRAWVETSEGERLEASRVLLAPGDGFRAFAPLAALPLHRTKGQTVWVRRPPGLGPLPVLSGFGYVVPEAEGVPEGGGLVLGSTYEHTFETPSPTPEGTRAILRKVARMVPALGEAEVVEARAGVRVGVPGAVSPGRLPFLGHLPDYRRVWAFVGLGSKGLLMAPLLAQALAAGGWDPESLPSEVRLGER
jgi:glycine/D-amino acid oxidase-like deaminating enzyme